MAGIAISGVEMNGPQRANRNAHLQSMGDGAGLSVNKGQHMMVCVLGIHACMRKVDEQSSSRVAPQVI